MDNNPFVENFAVIFVIALAQLLLGVPITSLLKRLGVVNPSPELITISCLLVAIFFIGLPLYILLFIGKKQRIIQLSARTGMVTIWKNFDSAKEDIRKHLLNSKNSVNQVSVLIHAGSNLINGSSSIIGGTFEEISRQAPHKKPRKVRILCSAIDSPYYTNPDYLKERFNQRKNDSDANWSEDKYIQTTMDKFQSKTRLIHSRVRSLINYGLKNVEIREHDEPYLWNMIIIDDKIFIQGDIYKNSVKDCPVMVFQKSSLSDAEGNSIYNYYYTFKKYFDDIWHHHSWDIEIGRSN